MLFSNISPQARRSIVVIIAGVILLILGTTLSATGHISIFSRLCMLLGMLTEMAGLFVVMRHILKNKIKQS